MFAGRGKRSAGVFTKNDYDVLTNVFERDIISPSNKPMKERKYFPDGNDREPLAVEMRCGSKEGMDS